MHENDDPWLAARGIDMFEQFDLYMEETVNFYYQLLFFSRNIIYSAKRYCDVFRKISKVNNSDRGFNSTLLNFSYKIIVRPTLGE